MLGVVDFVLKCGHVYGTVLLDMATGRPVDVLRGSAGEPLADWLRAHPGVEVIAYADGARDDAPDAIQVADRRHVWHHLGEAVDKTVAAHLRFPRFLGDFDLWRHTAFRPSGSHGIVLGPDAGHERVDHRRVQAEEQPDPLVKPRPAR